MSGFDNCVVLFTCVFLGVFWRVEAARILVVAPTPMYSHQMVFRPFTQQLAKRGHHVVFLTPDPAYPPGESPQNLTEINLHDITYKLWTENVTRMKQESDFNKQIAIGYDIIIDIFLKQMEAEEVRKLLSDNQQFDLIVIAVFMRSALALAHFYRAPAILMSTNGITDEVYEEGGVPIHPILIQLGDVPSLEELGTSVDLRVVNWHPMWGSCRPVTQNVVHLGGLHCVPPKDLPEDLKSLLDSSNRGVIYMSFGTNADPSHLPPERMAVFARVFATLPYDVLWKRNDAPQNLSSNVHTFPWLPQADLLRHEKLLQFITQGGLQSTDEALRAGVPLLGVPLWTDQWHNVENFQRFGVGLRLDLFALTESQLKEAIEKLINDKSFREKSAKVGRLMEDQPQSSLERAVWWTERVIRLRGRRLPTQPPPLTWDGLMQALLLAALIVPVSLIFLTILLFKLLRGIKLKAVARRRRN